MRRASAWQQASAAAVAVVLAAIVVVLLPDRAGACSCEYSKDPAGAVGGADVVLVGELQSVSSYKGVDDEFPGSGMQRQGSLLVEAVVADNPGSTIDAGSILTVQNPTLGCSEGQLELGAGPQVVLLNRVDGRLFVEGCLPAIAVDDVASIPRDLPPPPSEGPAALVTVGSSEGPSDLQLRDARGAVVAWGALPPLSRVVSICPGAEVVLARPWSAGGGEPIVAIDLATMTRRSLRMGALDEPAGGIACGDRAGRRLVRMINATDGAPAAFAIVDSDSGQTAATTEAPPSGRTNATIDVTDEGALVVTSGAGIDLLDPVTGELDRIAPLPVDTVPLATIPLMDGGVAVILASPEAFDAGGPPYAAILRTDADLTTAATIDIVEPSLHGDVTALPDGSLLVVDHDLHATLLAPDGAVTSRLVADDRQRSAAMVASSANRPVWLGVTGGELTWSEPGDTSVDLVVPIGIRARLVPERPVDPALRAVHTREALRARVLPDGWLSLPAPAERATDGELRTDLLALGAIGAAMAALGVAISLRRRAGATELDGEGER